MQPRDRWPVALAAVFGVGGCTDSTDGSNDDPSATPEAGMTAPAREAGAPTNTPWPTRSDDAAYLFDQNEIRTYEILISEEDLAFLDADPTAEIYVEGAFVFEGVRYEPVGIRYKGSFGAYQGCTEFGPFENGPDPSGAKTCTKLSTKVRFNWRDPEGRFYGQRRLQFHSMAQDESLLRERLSYALFGESDIPAPRAVHANLRVNGEHNGLYALVEQIDGSFTRSRFREEGGRGNLYKEVWPLYDEPSIYLSKLKTNEDENPSVDRMIRFAADLRNATEAELPDVAAKWTDTEYMARFMAADRLTRNDDGPMHFWCIPQRFGQLPPGYWLAAHPLGDFSCGNKNLYWYEEVASDRFWLLPWDFDHTLRRGSSVRVVSPWNDPDPSCDAPIDISFLGQMEPACDPLVRAWGSFRPEFAAAVRAFLDGPLQADNVDSKLAAWVEQLTPIVEQGLVYDEPRRSFGQWLLHVDELRATIDEVRNLGEAYLLYGPEVWRVEVGTTVIDDAGAPDASSSQDASTADAGQSSSGSDSGRDAASGDASIADGASDANSD